MKVLSGQEGEREDEGSWEFVPAKVPNGISLRNFGIQVVSFFFFYCLFLFFWSFSIIIFVRSFLLFFFFFFSVWGWRLAWTVWFHALGKTKRANVFFPFSLDRYPINCFPASWLVLFLPSVSIHSLCLRLLSSFQLFPLSLAMAYTCKLLCFFYASFHFCSAPMHSGLSVVFFASLWCSIQSGRWGLKQRGSTLFFAIFFSFVRSLIRSRRHYICVSSPIVIWPRHWTWTRALRIVKGCDWTFFCVAEHPTNCYFHARVFWSTTLLDHAYLRDCCCFRDARFFYSVVDEECRGISLWEAWG